jgi:hypothetical protein
MNDPSRPFWWANTYFDGAINSVERYYGVTRERKSNTYILRNDGMAKKLIKGMFPKADKNDELQGEQQFYSRLQLLLDAMNASCDEAIQLMLKAVRNHFDADQILSDTLFGRWQEYYSSKASQNEASDAIQQFFKNGVVERVAAVIWEELASSSERVRLLAEADDFEQQAKLLLA